MSEVETAQEAQDHQLVNDFDKFELTLTVPEAFEHPKGYTAYKIVIQATPKNALEQDACRFVTWTRYKRLRDLHQNLRVAHEQLRLRGALPDFPKPKLFGKHQPDTISDRRACAEAFLDFTIKHRLLSRVVCFVQFLTEFELEPDDALFCGDLAPVLEPTGSGLTSPDNPATRDTDEPDSPVEHTNTTTIRTADNVARYGRMCHGPSSDENNHNSNNDNLKDRLPANSTCQSPTSCDNEAKTNFAMNFERLPRTSRELGETVASPSLCVDHGTDEPLASPSREPSLVLSTTEDDWSYVNTQGDRRVPHPDHQGRESGEWLNESLGKLKAINQQADENVRNSNDSLTSSTTTNQRVSDVEARQCATPPLFQIEDCTLSASTSDMSSVRETSATSTNQHKTLLNTTAETSATQQPQQQSPFFKRRQHREHSPSKIARFFPKPKTHQTKRHQGSPSTSAPSSAHLKPVKSEGNFTDLLGTLANLTTGGSITASPKKQSFLKFLHKPNEQNSAQNDDYLVQAAQFISSAQQAEADGAYEIAFTCYKSAVNLMLQGVQHEQDLARRNAVRKKTAKYLLKAERLYRNFLAFDSGSFDVDKWAATVTAPSVQDPTLIAFQGERNELRHLRFVRVLSHGLHRASTLLVQDRNSSEHEPNLLVLKFLDKTCHYRVQQSATFQTQTSENFVPIQVPHMVQLIKYYETDVSVILLLEYNAHGSLATLLGEHLKWLRDRKNALQKQKVQPESDSETTTTSSTKTANVANPEQPRSPSKQQLLKRKSSSYSGRHITFSVGACEEPVLTEEDWSTTQTQDNSVFGEILQGNRVSLTSNRRSGDSFGDPFDMPSSSHTSTGIDLASEAAHASELKFSQVLERMQHQTDNTQHFSIVDDEMAPTERQASSWQHGHTDETRPTTLEPQQPISDDELSKSTNELNTIDVTEAWLLLKRLIDEKRPWPKGTILPEKMVRQWMVDVIEAMVHLHNEGVIIRDLGLHNLLLTSNGRIQLTYHSDWNCVDKSIDWRLVDQLYCAPEFRGLGVLTATDACSFWSLGAIFYELLTGHTLCSVCLHDCTLHTCIAFQDHVSVEAKDLICRLLDPRPQQRLGALNITDLQNHPFFRGVAWQDG